MTSLAGELHIRYWRKSMFGNRNRINSNNFTATTRKFAEKFNSPLSYLFIFSSNCSGSWFDAVVITCSKYFDSLHQLDREDTPCLLLLNGENMINPAHLEQGETALMCIFKLNLSKWHLYFNIFIKFTLLDSTDIFLIFWLKILIYIYIFNFDEKNYTNRWDYWGCRLHYWVNFITSHSRNIIKLWNGYSSTSAKLDPTVSETGSHGIFAIPWSRLY